MASVFEVNRGCSGNPQTALGAESLIMTMAEYIEQVQTFNEWLESELEIADVSEFRDDYPKAYLALQNAWNAEQNKEGGAK